MREQAISLPLEGTLTKRAAREQWNLLIGDKGEKSEIFKGVEGNKQPPMTC